MRCRVPCRGSAASCGFGAPEPRVRVAVRRALLREVRGRLRVAHRDAEPERRPPLEVPRPAGAVLLRLRRAFFGQLHVVEEVLTSGAGPVRGELHGRLVVPGVRAVVADRVVRIEAHERPLLAQGLAVAVSLCDRRPGKGRQDHKGQRDDAFHPSLQGHSACFPCVADDRPHTARRCLPAPNAQRPTPSRRPPATLSHGVPAGQQNLSHFCVGHCTAVGIRLCVLTAAALGAIVLAVPAADAASIRVPRTGRSARRAPTSSCSGSCIAGTT